jgi:hypothetical protein
MMTPFEVPQGIVPSGYSVGTPLTKNPPYLHNVPEQAKGLAAWKNG